MAQQVNDASFSNESDENDEKKIPVKAVVAVGKNHKFLLMRMMAAAAVTDSAAATGHHQWFGQKTEERTSNQKQIAKNSSNQLRMA